MKKKIIISECYECPHCYFDAFYVSSINSVCTYEKNCADPDGIMLEHPNVIPDWCKLETVL